MKAPPRNHKLEIKKDSLECSVCCCHNRGMKNKKTVKIKNQKTGKYVDIDKIPVSAFFE
jgi:hypothetical protein